MNQCKKIWEDNDRYKKSFIARNTKHPVNIEAFMTVQKVDDAKKLKALIESDLGITMRVVRRRDNDGVMLNVFLTSKKSQLKVQKYIWNIDNFTDNEKYFNVKQYRIDLLKEVFE